MTVEQRFKSHLRSKPEQHNYQMILCAIQKYGREHFNVETLVEGIETREELDALEEKYIADYNSLKPNGYNLCPGGTRWRNSKTANVEVDYDLVNDYLSGMSLRAVAEKHGCSPTKVKKHVLKSGNQLRKNNNPYSAHASALTEEELRKFFLAEKLTDAEISERTGLSKRWVRKRRQIFNIHRI